jgi:hypothetical protein
MHCSNNQECIKLVLDGIMVLSTANLDLLAWKAVIFPCMYEVKLTKLEMTR